VVVGFALGGRHTEVLADVGFAVAFQLLDSLKHLSLHLRDLVVELSLILVRSLSFFQQFAPHPSLKFIDYRNLSMNSHLYMEKNDFYTIAHTTCL
jgi:hypothetical protein